MNTSPSNDGQDQLHKGPRNQMAILTRPAHRSNVLVKWVILLASNKPSKGNRNSDMVDPLNSRIFQFGRILFLCYLILFVLIIPIIILGVMQIVFMIATMLEKPNLFEYVGQIFGIFEIISPEGQTLKQIDGTLESALEKIETNVMHVVLDVIDLTLIANLVVMVFYISYITYVSKKSLVTNKSGYLPWLSALKNGSFEGVHRMKVLFLTSLVTISAVHLLELMLKAEMWRENKPKGEGGMIPKEEITRFLIDVGIDLGGIGLCVIVLFSLVMCALLVAKINQLDSHSQSGENKLLDSQRRKNERPFAKFGPGVRTVARGRGGGC